MHNWKSDLRHARFTSTWHPQYSAQDNWRRPAGIDFSDDAWITLRRDFELPDSDVVPELIAEADVDTVGRLDWFLGGVDSLG
jgi:hypothetical protein